MPAPAAAVPIFKFIGSAALKQLTKKPLRTACWTVEDSARAAFRNGQVAKYKIDSTAAHLRDGMGWTDAELYDHFTVQMLADIHLDAYVPLCLFMEAGQHTEHPDTGVGAQIKAAADAEFQRMVRHGEIEFTDRHGKTIRRLHVTPAAPSLPTVAPPGFPRDTVPGVPDLIDLGTPANLPRAIAGMPVLPLVLGLGALAAVVFLSRRGGA